MQVKEQEHYFFAVSAVVHGKYAKDDLETVYSHVVPSDQWKYVSIECMDADSQVKPEEQEMVSYLQTILTEFCGHGIPIMETEEEIQNVNVHHGHNIRRTRIEKNIKQDALAALVNMTQPNVSKYEKMRVIEDERLKRFARALNLPL